MSMATKFIAGNAEAGRASFATLAEFHGAVAADQQFGAGKTVALDDAPDHDALGFDLEISDSAVDAVFEEVRIAHDGSLGLNIGFVGATDQIKFHPGGVEQLNEGASSFHLEILRRQFAAFNLPCPGANHLQKFLIVELLVAVLVENLALGNIAVFAHERDEALHLRKSLEPGGTINEGAHFRLDVKNHVRRHGFHAITQDSAKHERLDNLFPTLA